MKTPAPVVKKFGGTSVGSLERLEVVSDLILKDVQKGKLPVVVLSAMSGETNRLVKMASQVDAQNKSEAYDMLLASGEQVSVALMAMALGKKGVKAVPLLAFQLGIQTNSMYSRARIEEIRVSKLKNLLSRKCVPVVAGFQGIDREERITTLGRGGSDITAVALAAALGSPVCEIYTDVPFVFSADPRWVQKARALESLSYEEMMEMSSLGSKVLQTRSVELAAKFGVKICVRSSFEEKKGTWIVSEEEGKPMEQPLVTSVVHELNTMMARIYPLPEKEDFLFHLFESLSKKGVVVDIITKGAGKKGEFFLSFSFGLEEETQVDEVLNSLMEKESFSYMKDVAKLSVVGVGMKNHPGVASLFFRTLSEAKIPLHLITTSEIKISSVIDKKNLKKGAESLHKAFGLDSRP